MAAPGPTEPVFSVELCRIVVQQLPERLLSSQTVLQFFSVCGEVQLVHLDEAQRTATFLAQRSVGAKCCLLSGLEVQGSSLIVAIQQIPPVQNTPIPEKAPDPPKYIYTVSPDDQVVKFPVPADLESLKAVMGQAFGGRVFELRTGLAPLRSSADLATLAKSTWVVAAYELAADPEPELEVAAVSHSLHHSLHLFASQHGPGAGSSSHADSATSPISSPEALAPRPSVPLPPAPLSSSPLTPEPSPAGRPALGDCLLVEAVPALLGTLPGYRAELMQGYLALQPLGFRHSHWTYRYCVLLPDGLVRLRFLAGPGGPVALVKGVIELRHIAEAELLAAAFHLYLAPESPSPNKHFVLVPASSTDLASWMEALRAAGVRVTGGPAFDARSTIVLHSAAALQDVLARAGLPAMPSAYFYMSSTREPARLLVLLVLRARGLLLARVHKEGSEYELTALRTLRWARLERIEVRRDGFVLVGRADSLTLTVYQQREHSRWLAILRQHFPVQSEDEAREAQAREAALAQRAQRRVTALMARHFPARLLPSLGAVRRGHLTLEYGREAARRAYVVLAGEHLHCYASRAAYHRGEAPELSFDLRSARPRVADGLRPQGTVFRVGSEPRCTFSARTGTQRNHWVVALHAAACFGRAPAGPPSQLHVLALERADLLALEAVCPVSLATLAGLNLKYRSGAAPDSLPLPAPLLQALPGACPHLRYLKLHRCRVGKAFTLASLAQLEELHLGRVAGLAFPLWLAELKALRVLCVNHAPGFVAQQQDLALLALLPRLQRLSLRGSVRPTTVGLESNSLVSLDLSDNSLCHLPHLDTPELRLLLLLRNDISGGGPLPPSLTCLQLGFNKMPALLPAITALPRLRHLDLSFNHIRLLEGLAGRLPLLVRLDLTGNPLQTLPATLGQRPGLASVQLSPGRLHLPAAALASTPALCRYLAELNERPVHWAQQKLLLLGAEGTGKSSLASLLRGERPRKTPSTVGVQIDNFGMDGPGSEPLQFSLWDFGGQAVASQTHQFFLSDHSIYLLVFSLVTQDFDRVLYWLNEIRCRTEAAKVLLVGTFADEAALSKEAKFALRRRCAQLQQTFGFIRGSHFVSCRSQRGLAELTQSVLSLAQRHYQRNSSMPESWLFLLRHLGQAPPAQRWLTWPEWLAAAAAYNIPPADAGRPLRFLHDAGALTWLQQHEKQHDKDLIVLNSQAMADVFASVATMQGRWAASGVVPRAELWRAWQQHPAEQHDALLAVLERFGLALPMADGLRVFFPGLIAEPHPPAADFEFVWPTVPASGAEYHRLYRFAFLPESVFGRLLFHLYHMPLTVLQVWRDGIVFRLQSELVLLRHSASQLELSVRAPEGALLSSEALRTTVDLAETVLDGFYYRYLYRMQRIVPCNHCSPEDRTQFPVQQVLQSLQLGEPLACRGVAVSAGLLAPDLALVGLPTLRPEEIEAGPELGRGAFGVITAGRLRSTGEAVAVKAIELEAEQQALTEFLREIYIMAALEHPNLLRLLAVRRQPLAIVMELAPHGDLFHALHGPRPAAELTPAVARLVALDIASGLAYLAGQKPPVLHRDLRSPNIFLLSFSSEPGDIRAKIGDFGLARHIQPFVGGYLGAWQWLAPEVLEHRTGAYTAAADVYSLGMLVYELVYRSVPFDHLYGEAGYVAHGELVVGRVRRAIVEDGLRPRLTGGPYDRLLANCWGRPADRPTSSSNSAQSSQLTTQPQQPAVLTVRQVQAAVGELAGVRGLAQSASPAHQPAAALPPADLFCRSLAAPAHQRLRALCHVPAANQATPCLLRPDPLELWLWAGGLDGWLFVWSLADDALVASLQLDSASVHALSPVPVPSSSSSSAFGPADAVLALCGPGLWLVSVSGRRPKKTQLRLYSHDLRSLAPAPDASLFLCTYKGHIEHLAKRKKVIAAVELGEAVSSMQLGGGALWLATPAGVVCLSLELERLRFYPVDWAGIPCPFVLSEETLFVGNVAGEFLRLDLASGSVRRSQTGRGRIVTLHALGREVWLALNDGSLLRWPSHADAASGEVRKVHEDRVRELVSVGAGLLYSCAEDGLVCAWSNPEQPY